MSTQSLIIFQKNLVEGKVKTRLAAEIGNEKALEIYRQLVDHTHNIIKDTYVDKFIFYSDFLEPADASYYYNEEIQTGSSLGERMLNAFTEILHSGYRKVVIIGTDCLELTTELVNQSFEMLDTYDVVIGPAKDGGYYLLGMKELHISLFENKAWGTDMVLPDTISDLKRLNKSYFLLPELNDIDREEDLKYFNNRAQA